VLFLAGLHAFLKDQLGKDRVMEDSTTAKTYSLRCPFCEVYELELRGRASMRCPSCESFLGGDLLKTLHHITELPDAIGRHACECGHPEMRRLPDEVYWCPACGSEVLPISQTPEEGSSPTRRERA
jgi:ribosomal protein L37AE/L43A